MLIFQGVSVGFKTPLVSSHHQQKARDVINVVEQANFLLRWLWKAICSTARSNQPPCVDLWMYLPSHVSEFRDEFCGAFVAAKNPTASFGFVIEQYQITRFFCKGVVVQGSS